MGGSTRLGPVGDPGARAGAVERAGLIRLRVWDLPIRLFHWGLAASVVGSVVSVKLGAMEVHGYFGLFTLSVLLWRLVWGFVGSGPARFASFVVSPITTLRYLRGQIEDE